jgi:unsaturated rhamnogalacturonyl hydrolase
MKSRCLSLGLALSLLSLAPLGVAEGETVKEVMERVADWQLAHPNPERGADGWENAAFYAGVMALTRESASSRFEAAMVNMAEANHWQLGKRVYHADDHAVGQTYAELFLKSKDARMIAPMQERFDFILAHPKDNNLSFDGKKNPDRGDRWSWCDALFMAPPAWIRLWKATGNQAYLDFAVEKWWLTSDYLYDKEEHLYFRDSTLFERREKNGRKIFWSRGNGWVIAGLARFLELLPADHPARPRFEQQFREMAEKILSCQQEDGFWRSSLLDPASYPMHETSGTGFHCFAFAWGINHGLLERAKFEPAVRRAWASLVSCVKADGRLTHVQPIGYTPVTFDAESTEPFGVGAFLLAGTEVNRLAAP